MSELPRNPKTGLRQITRTQHRSETVRWIREADAEPIELVDDDGEVVMTFGSIGPCDVCPTCGQVVEDE